MNRKLLALLLIPVAMLCVGLGVAGMICVHDWKDPATDYLCLVALAAGLMSALGVGAYANRLWQEDPRAFDASQSIPPDHRRCDWCQSAVGASRGKLVAMPKYQGLKIRSGNQFVCHPCLRKSRTMRAAAILGALGLVGGYFLVCYLMFG